MNQPIKRTAHGAIDYGFVALNLLGPLALGLDARTRTVFAGFAAMQGTINVLTDQPLAAKKLIPFRTHGYLEAASGPAFVAVPWLTRSLEQTRARAFWGGALALLATVYTLTDWESAPGS